MLGSSLLSGTGKSSFPDPYLDMASLLVPKSSREVLDLCERLWMRNGTYRMAAGRIVRYFITNVSFGDAGADTRQRLSAFMKNRLRIVENLALIGDDFLCFHGGTPVVTRDGIYPIRELTGKTIDVLSSGGVYRPAEFKAFGTQELLEVVFADGRTVLATPEHQWHVLSSGGGTVVVPTVKLEGRSIRRTVAARPPKTDEYYEGVRHGFVFGDGSIYNKSRKTPMGVANFYGEKARAMLPYFEGYGSRPRHYPELKLTKVHGLPAYYKKLPANTSSASYWYGFVCGFLAADGSVDVYGCPLLTQVSVAALEAVAAQLPRLGMVAGPIRQYEAPDRVFTHKNGTQYTAAASSYCVMSLFKQFMQADDLIIHSHIAKFTANKTTTNYGKHTQVKAVRATGIVDQVYCCVEPDTHTFVIGNGILTGNCYGNSLSSIVVPFRRVLQCTECSTECSIEKADWVFENWKFRAFCHKCRKRTVHKHDDRPDRDESRIRVLRWPAQQFHLLSHFYSGDTEFYWRIPETIKGELARGCKFHVQHTPWEIIEAARDNKYFKFNKDVIYHMKEQTLSGIATNGWGVSRMLATFAQSYYVQMLKRYNESIVADHLNPMRVVTPKMTGASFDPAMSANLAGFKQKFMQAVKRHRQDPSTWNFMPFPVEYTAMGGTVNPIASELLGQAMDEQLNAIGIPSELYKGTLELQAMPTALRLFQQTWPQLVSAMNGWLEWSMSAICTHMSWDKPDTVELEPVTMADDVELRQTWLQLASSKLVSRRTAFGPWSLDPEREQRQVLEEEAKMQELQEEVAHDIEQRRLSQQAARSGGPTPGGQAMGPGAPAGGGTNQMSTVGMTPEEMAGQAAEMAAELVRMPEIARKRQLRDIREQAPVLHSLVTASMQQERSQAGSAGREMLAEGQM